MGDHPFSAHVTKILADVRAAMAEARLETLVLEAGTRQYYPHDDQEITFKTLPHFRRFVPVESPDHLLVITQNAARVIEVLPIDYWEEHGGEDDFWKSEYDVEVVATKEEAWAKVGDVPREIPEAILTALDTSRAVKTEYEVECLREANRLSAPAHVAARDAFMAGGSELDIHNAFIAASGTTSEDFAYPSIIALNEKGATLHYRRKRADVRDGKSFLIDAGLRYRGYCADISRTYTRGADERFVSMIAALDSLQKELVQRVKPGVPFIELHHETHMGVAKILKESGVATTDSEELIKSGVTRAFFPHGLGHMLGIQVHDVGNRSDEGLTHPLRELYPHLRTNRTLAEGMVTTIEPGIYFNEILLAPLRSSEAGKFINWAAVDTLMPYGGIRIEDNIVVRAAGPDNLTRPFLP